MVFELIAIGGVVYYYVRRNKQQKLKKAAWAAGQPWTNKDGSVTYPAGFPGLPGQPRVPEYTAGDYKVQIPVTSEREVPQYTDEVRGVGEKAPLITETRELVGAEMREKQ